MLTIINNNSDPTYNLALEEYILKHLNIVEDIVLVWQNNESVIIGKDQNPFIDVNGLFVRDNNIPIIRRNSLGKSFYYDHGIISYTFVVRNTRNTIQNYQSILDPIIAILNKVSVFQYTFFENEIYLNGERVSSNIQSFHQNTLIHHGTLYFNPNLEKLSKSFVNPNCPTVSTTDVNIIKNNLKNKMTIKQFMKYFLMEMIDGTLSHNLYNLDEIDKNKVTKLAKSKYSSWDWNYGETSEFLVIKEFDNRMLVNLIVKNGVIDKVSVDSYEKVIDLEKKLLGAKFNKTDLREALESCHSVNLDDFIDTILY